MAKVVFTVTVKQGNKVLTEIEGKSKNSDFLSLSTFDKIIETEQFLEKLTGYRWHIHRNLGQ